MDSEVNLLLDRAENELLVARSLVKLSENKEDASIFELPEGTTFYSGAISHSYYAIFYCAKAYLLSKGIKLSSKQGQHQQVYFKFKNLVKEGVIEGELLKIYEDLKIKAESLLEILHNEKEKRKTFTYETHSQANKEPAEESLKNATFFIAHIRKFIENSER